ncbi:MAG: STAS-like domain-containing protein [Rhizomicrobium sp.]
MARPKNPRIREFILRNISEHPADIASFAAQQLAVTRASANGYLRVLVADGLVEATGNTKARRYQLRTLDFKDLTLNLNEKNQEDVVWRDEFFPRFESMPDNVTGLCEYGFLEMLNNAIEHSEGTTCRIVYGRNYENIWLQIRDNGIGIFDKITKECQLTDKHEAILELSKGKLTTDKSRHTGEGIFFTSRMVDWFEIVSGGLAYMRRRTPGDDWLIDVETRPGERGTAIYMRLSTAAMQTTRGVFDKYVDDDARFSKTIVPLKLAKYEGEHLVSRSQARRIMMRVERFSDVWLDFEGVADIGQPFADEIFRVWQSEHSKVRLTPHNASPEIVRMIQHAHANANERQRTEASSVDGST